MQRNGLKLSLHCIKYWQYGSMADLYTRDVSKHVHGTSLLHHTCHMTVSCCRALLLLMNGTLIRRDDARRVQLFDKLVEQTRPYTSLHLAQ